MILYLGHILPNPAFHILNTFHKARSTHGETLRPGVSPQMPSSAIHPGQHSADQDSGRTASCSQRVPFLSFSLFADHVVLNLHKLNVLSSQQISSLLKYSLREIVSPFATKNFKCFHNSKNTLSEFYFLL